MRSDRRTVGSMAEEKGSRERCRSWTVLHAQCTSTLSSVFPLSQGNAQALERWVGKTKHCLISYFLSNISAKNYRNRTVYVKTTASQRWDVFETRCSIYRRAFCRCRLETFRWGVDLRSLDHFDLNGYVVDSYTAYIRRPSDLARLCSSK